MAESTNSACGKRRSHALGEIILGRSAANFAGPIRAG